MKDEILEELRNRDDFVSGQELCEKLQVSRTAVWKKISQLRQEGYEIEAVPNRGYRIRTSPDVMTAEEVRSRMQTKWIGREVYCFDEIDSTNQYAKKIGEEGAPEGALILAEKQTAGKGRSGRRWETPAGVNIAMSLLLRPSIAPERISMVTLVVGMAITKACRELYALPLKIKWPNDIVIDGKKLSGTLTEMSAEMMAVNYIVVGTGINVNQKSFPEELSGKATSLALELKRDVNRAELTARVVFWFEKYYEQFLQTADLSLLQEEYNEMLVNTGRRVRVLEPGNEYNGEALGIDFLGELLVKTEDGSIRKVYAGEVSVRGIYGYV